MGRFSALSAIVLTCTTLSLSAPAKAAEEGFDYLFENGASLHLPTSSYVLAKNLVFTTRKGKETKPFENFGPALTEARVLHSLPTDQPGIEVMLITEFGILLFDQMGRIRLDVDGLNNIKSNNKLNKKTKLKKGSSELLQLSSDKICTNVANGGATDIGLGQNRAIEPRNFDSDGIPERRGSDIDSGTSGYEGLH